MDVGGGVRLHRRLLRRTFLSRPQPRQPTPDQIHRSRVSVFDPQKSVSRGALMSGHCSSTWPMTAINESSCDPAGARTYRGGPSEHTTLWQRSAG